LFEKLLVKSVSVFAFFDVFPGIRELTVTLPAHIQWDNTAAEKSPVVESIHPVKPHKPVSAWYCC
jgi:hypothetical protein